MSYVNRRRYTCGLWILIAFALAGLTPPSFDNSGPLPPIGWEKDVIPGFEPSIESVLIRMSNYQNRPTQDELAATWEEWGTEGVAALVKLIGEEQWKPFTEYAEQLLIHTKNRAALDYFLKRIDPLPALPADSREQSEAIRRYSQICADVGRVYGSDAAPALQRILESSEIPHPLRLAAINGLALGESDEGRAVLNEACRRWMDSTNEEERYLAVNILLRMDTAETYEQAKSIATTLQRSEFKHVITQIEWIGKSMRAREPMSIILEKEAMESQGQ